MIHPMGLKLETAIRRVTHREDCFDGRAFHTFVQHRNDGKGDGVQWWCDYCGELITRRPTAAETAMQPGVSP